MIALVLAAGCGPKHVVVPAPPAPPAPPPAAMIVLLPDPETGTTGRIHVSNAFGSVDLSTPRAAMARVTADARPGTITTMSDVEVQRVFGQALAALPPAPRHFTLHFRFESDVLTTASTALIPEILKTVKGLAFPEVVVVGHTDTMGAARANYALGIKRANTVREILVRAGLSPATVEVTSHGEADLLVKTPDNTPEPRNRRVEITVR